MFDIDGTLVDSVGFDSRYYADAVRSVLNVEIDDTWRPYKHVTDSGILEELLASREFDRPHRRAAHGGETRVRRGRSRALRARARYAVREIAGAKALFDHLTSSCPACVWRLRPAAGRRPRG